VVAIHEIPLDTCAAGPAEGAVAFNLIEDAQTDRLYRFCAQTWEVELRRGGGHVVARTTDKLTRSALLNAAIDVTNRALDLLSIEGQEHLNTRAPASDCVLLVRESGRVIVRFSAVSDFPIRSHFSIMACATREEDTVW
jgi:hypothetical protein